MTKVVSALTARTQFGQIMQRVKKKGERFVVDRRGEPQAVIMGIEDFINTVAPPPEFLSALRAESKRQGLDQLTVREIDAEVTTARRSQKRQAKKSVKPRR
jgi:prevent-host-death family protein